MTQGTTASEPTRGKTALIVEGGAMRGAWAAGVLAFLHERGLHQYDRVYAASSGACSAAYFVAGMWEPGLQIWREHIHGRKLVRKLNFLRHKPLIDLAYLIDHVFKKSVPLSVEALQKAPTEFYIVLTDCATGQPLYFRAQDENIFDALRASASMPFATRGYDFVQGRPYADGGVADPVPIEKAIADGATDITMVMTHNASYRMGPIPRFLTRMAYPEFSLVADLLAQQHIIYNRALDVMNNPPAGVRVRVFRPLKPLQVRLLTQTQCRIEAALRLGHDEALQQLAADLALHAVPTPAPAVIQH